MEFKIVDVKKFKIADDQKRKQFEGLARMAELAERHEDMCAFMKEVVHAAASGDDLSFEERNLLSVAYKNAVGARRASWRALNAEDYRNNAWIQTFKTQVEEELRDLCHDVLKLLEDTLIKHPKASQDALIFYKKMAGDYYRYLAEFLADKDYDKKSASFYALAMQMAQETMEPTDPVRLGLALNYSVCLYEIVKDKEKACKLAKDSFDDAIKMLDKLEDQQYKDGTLILQLLRDNLTLWTSDSEYDNADGETSNM